MTKKYERLSLYERFQIEKLLSHKKSYSDIAILLGRNKSTIQREVSKYGKANYKSLEAERMAVGKSSDRKNGKSKINTCNKLRMDVLIKLGWRWSPEQISISLAENFPQEKNMQLSFEAIYLHIYVHSKMNIKNVLIRQLRQERKFRGNVRRGKDKRTTIKDPIRIDERPLDVLGRQKPGHWEGDLVMGKDRESAIGTLVERTTRMLIIVYLLAKDATSVRKAFEREFKNIPRHMKLTMTYDNGTEMAQHELFTKNTKIDVYFAHPYSPWERGTNENTNGLIRDYFPKGTDFSTVSKKELKRVQNELNKRPRKVLNSKTPIAVFESYSTKKAA
jgi:IS30 family transposase